MIRFFDMTLPALVSKLMLPAVQFQCQQRLTISSGIKDFLFYIFRKHYKFMIVDDETRVCTGTASAR